MSRNTEESRKNAKNNLKKLRDIRDNAHPTDYSEPESLGRILLIVHAKDGANKSLGYHEIRQTNILYSVHADYIKTSQSELKKGLAKQVLYCCQALNSFFDKADSLPENYKELKFNPSNSSVFKFIQINAKIVQSTTSLSNDDINVFRRTLAKILFENYKILSQYLSLLNEEDKKEAKECLLALKKYNHTVINDTQFVEHLFSNQKIYHEVANVVDYDIKQL